MFELVADIEKYPEFLPWCKSLRIVSIEKEDGGDQETLVSDMIVGYRVFRETLRSRVTLDRQALVITADYVRGPLRNMSNNWSFEPFAAPGEAITSQIESKVDFEISFSMSNPVLQRAANAIFEDAFAKMSDAFIDRAHEIYGR